jgi:peptidoglycan/LPS O-acetylase OafA/YrhL
VIVFGSQISILIWMLHIPVDTILKQLAIRLGVNQDTLNSWPFAATSMVATLLTASLANAIPWRAIAAKAKRESPVPAAG